MRWIGSGVKVEVVEKIGRASLEILDQPVARRRIIPCIDQRQT